MIECKAIKSNIDMALIKQMNIEFLNLIKITGVPIFNKRYLNNDLRLNQIHSKNLRTVEG